MISHTGTLHQLLFPSVTWRMKSSGVYLTFDDGPHEKATPAVLKVLDKHKIRATFFLNGEAVKRNGALVKEVASAGHTIGIHAYHHSRLLAFSRTMTMDEIRKTEDIINNIVSLKIRLFRPPYGMLTWNTLRAVKELQYRIIMWSTLTGDYRTTWTDDRVVRTGLAKLSDGAILVFHDNNLTCTRISSVLSEIIAKIKERGFSFERIQ